MTDTPKTASEFVETMLRSCVEADRLATEHTNNPLLHQAEVQASVNGFVAAMAMDHLRRHAANCADSVVELLVNVLNSSHLGVAARRVATGFDYDYDGWITTAEQRTAKAQQPVGGELSRLYRIERSSQPTMPEGGAS